MSRTSTISSSREENEKADLKINLKSVMLLEGKRKQVSDDNSAVKKRVFEKASMLASQVRCKNRSDVIS
jgi:hypothetical protein